MREVAAYYNEIDKHAAAWLRNLITAGHIAPGDVDERSITEVQPDDLRGYTQCHFFAGIGGWSYAMRLAGWPDHRPVWTGSCPCQPFSTAGAQRGSDDERHLWPAFFRLISECRPASIFGEQVAGAAGLAWLDHVCADLEDAGYAAAAANLGAHSVGAPHLRQRLYWVAHSHAAGLGEQRLEELLDRQRPAQRDDADRCGAHGFVADIACIGRGHGCAVAARSCARNGAQNAEDCDAGILVNASGQGLEIERRFPGVSRGSSGSGAWQATERADPLAAWADIEWIECSDGKARPIESVVQQMADGIPESLGRMRPDQVAEIESEVIRDAFPLAHGVPGRVGRLRAYGNAIVPQVAAAFVAAADARPAA